MTARSVYRGGQTDGHGDPAGYRGVRVHGHLAVVISRTRLDPCDAEVAAVADASVCAILTLDGAKWQGHARDLDEPLRYIEITDPDDE
jgi:hypothetical protein